MRTNGLTRLALMAIKDQPVTVENSAALIDLATCALDEIDRLNDELERVQREPMLYRKRARALIDRSAETLGRYENDGKPYMLTGAVSDIIQALRLVVGEE